MTGRREKGPPNNERKSSKRTLHKRRAKMKILSPPKEAKKSPYIDIMATISNNYLPQRG